MDPSQHPARRTPPHQSPLDRILSAQRILIGDVERGADFRFFRPHGRRDHLLSLSLAGTGLQGDDRHLASCEPGSIALWQPGTAQYYATATGCPAWRQLWIHFQARPHWQPWLKWPSTTPGFAVIPTVARSKWRQICTYAHTIAHLLKQDRGPLDEDLALIQCEQLLLTIEIATRGYGQRETAIDPRIMRALDLLHDRPEQAWTVSALAGEAGLSTSHFSQLFRHSLGCSPQRYAEEYRLRQAHDLLRRGGSTVAETAAAVGFSDPFYFSSRYRRLFGHPPSHDRR